MGGIFQNGISGSSAGLISIAQNLLSKPDPATVEFGGTALHDTIGDLNGFYLKFTNGPLWWEGGTGGQPAAAIGPGTRMMWIPQTGTFVAGQASGSQLDSPGFGNAVFGINNNAGSLTFCNIIGGIANTVGGNDNLVIGNTNNVSGADNIISGIANFVFGDNSIITGSDNQLNGMCLIVGGQQIHITNNASKNSIVSGHNSTIDTVLSSFINAESADFTLGQNSILAIINELPNPSTVNSAVRTLGILLNGTLDSVSSIINIDSTGNVITSQNDIIVGSTINTNGSRNIIFGSDITNNGAGNYLFGKNISNTKSDVLVYQQAAGLNSIYAELKTAIQELGIGFGTTSVSEGFVNYVQGNTLKAVEHYEPAGSLKTLPVTGDFEADSLRLYYTVTPGTRETVSYLSDTYQQIKLSLSSAQILALNSTPIQILPAPGAGFTYDILSVRTRYNSVTLPYTTNLGLRIGYQGATGNLYTSNSILNSTVTRIEQIPVTAPSGTNTTFILENTAVLIDVLVGNPIAGDGTLDVYLTYKKVAL